MSPPTFFSSSSSSLSVGPVANATDVLQPDWLIALTLSPPRLLRSSHVRCQVPPRPRRERSWWRKVEMCEWELAGNFAWNCDFHVNSGFFYVPQICDMGPTALLPIRRKACWGIFRPGKSWWLRPGLNPQTWVLKGSTLPLDHRSRSAHLGNTFWTITVARNILNIYCRGERNIHFTSYSTFLLGFVA